MCTCSLCCISVSARLKVPNPYNPEQERATYLTMNSLVFVTHIECCASEVSGVFRRHLHTLPRKIAA
jgi:hypothetical protein